MHVCINYSVEMGIWTIFPQGSTARRKLVADDQIPEQLRPLFEQAKEAAVSGRADGICVDM